MANELQQPARVVGKKSYGKCRINPVANREPADRPGCRRWRQGRLARVRSLLSMKLCKFILVSAVFLCLFDCVQAEEPSPLRINVSLSTKEVTAASTSETVVVTITISTANDHKYDLDIGSFAECFGVYILGPWGPVPTRLGSSFGWMHGEHSASVVHVIEKNKPYSTEFRLSEYFDIADPEKFRPGQYQMNIKFYGSGLRSPIDSGPLTFVVKK